MTQMTTVNDARQAGDEPLFLNRELSWLEFNDRVLHQAIDERTPLLERVRFLSIYSSNLDEFFMKRVGGLRRQMAMGVASVGHEGRSPEDLLLAIRDRVLPSIARKAKCYKESVRPALKEVGIEMLNYSELTDAEREETQSWYQRDVFPVLTPLAVDQGHRFPFISNLSLSLGILLRRPLKDETLFARVKIPEVVPQWYRLADSLRFVSLLDVVRHNLHDLFPGMEIVDAMAFRVTRNADVKGDNEDAEDLLSQIQQQLRDRRFAPVVRMQVLKGSNQRILKFFANEMGVEPRDIYETTGLVAYQSLDEIANLPMPELHFSSWSPITPIRLRDEDEDIFSVIRRGDVLVHHPYESFHDSVERFVSEAARDPNVLAIKQALYRTSGESPFIHDLIRAAESGKQVAVLVELRARFDEERNIRWARELEDAGIHVAYGVVGFKTHTKITLVVRKEAKGVRCYAHIGTGNYHSKTAKLYEDIGLLTAEPVLTHDVVSLFNFITGRSTQEDYQKLLVAPSSMKRRFLRLIEREVEHEGNGAGGRIIAKMNQLQDTEVIRALYDASRAGVKIDLIVRGFCTLRPGVPGLSENIRVMSVIGRFLEHSRIFCFRNGKDDPLDSDFFIGSADWMHRNLNDRVEAITPVEDRALRERLWRVIQLPLVDRRQCWDMQPDGSYTLRDPAGHPPESAETMGSHATLMKMARERTMAAEAAEESARGSS